MKQKYVITIGYTQLAFDEAETAMRAYALLTESTPCSSFHVYGSEYKRPDQYQNVEYVRNTGDVEIELKRVDASKFALDLTDAELREKCRVQPTEVDGEARLVDIEVPPAQIAGPEADAPADEPDFI
ncbi:hypothetical protein [Burkholderia seminalis]|uniref:hypothetical protein n=1 Tax=Burkholderia seminalis TaxID=488731 RepID=UPI00264B0FB6|nr:hypothetical protein [Burkholderia seminalis]MDN7848095.1 hypothetical protein [Burkholderia seminalis]